MLLSSPTANASLSNHPNPSTATNNDPSMLSSSQEVQWQTAFWSLVGLAILTMSQPCGRVCSFSTRYRTYLRSSPFICAADTLSIGFRLLVAPIYLRVSPICALRMLQHERFQDADEAEGLQALGSSTIGRWIFALLGPLPVMIKLASFSGTPWTQALGTSYMVSFVVTEFIILSATIDDPDTEPPDRVMPPTYVPNRWLGQGQSRTANARASIQKAFRDIEEPLAIMIICAQYAALIGPAIVWSMVRLTNFAQSITSPVKGQYDGPAEVGLIWLFSILGFSFLFLASLLITVLPGIALKNYCQKNTTVGKWLAVAFPESEGSTRLVVDGVAIVALSFFLLNVVTALIGYRLWFDSTGTSNPHWTTIFGKLVRPSSTTTTTTPSNST